MRVLAAHELEPFLRRLILLLTLVTGLVLFGTIGLSLTEDVSLWHGFLWSIDTVATVGTWPRPETVGGQVVKSLLILLGVGTLFYALVTVTEVVVSGHVAALLQERRERRAIDGLTDHHIICGFGRVGRQVARDLRAAGARYVVVDGNPDNRELARGIGVRFIEGAASEDSVLLAAGIRRARAVLACVDSDAENIFITLTARELRPDIAIVARAASEDSEPKLRRAGATRVISPYKASGAEMARLALHPQVTGVLDVAPEYRMEEIEVVAGSEGEGRKLGDIRGGAIIVAMRSVDGTFQPQPPSETRLRAGDVLVAMGTERTMDRLGRVFAPEQAPAPR
ncbi:MAG TPA: NAD-binding protein [Solirubrobacteraceae bacterium]|nr:NAD-binding protein [Solirubrobacteraceae bacterium]